MTRRVEVDVSELPTTTFGHRDLAWWATVSFVVIEGVTLAITVVTYFYLRRNFPQWPPPRTPRPDLGVGALQVGLMIASWVPIGLLDRAARAMHLRSLRRWLIASCLFAVAFVGLRAAELGAVHTTWDSNAYGSAVWLVLLGHGTLLLVEAIELLTMAVLFYTSRITERHFSDVSDIVVYWYFMTGVWIPLAAMVYLVPRLG